jgi:hypothetical protein
MLFPPYNKIFLADKYLLKKMPLFRKHNTWLSYYIVMNNKKAGGLY